MHSHILLQNTHFYVLRFKDTLQYFDAKGVSTLLEDKMDISIFCCKRCIPKFWWTKVHYYSWIVYYQRCNFCNRGCIRNFDLQMFSPVIAKKSITNTWAKELSLRINLIICRTNTWLFPILYKSINAGVSINCRPLQLCRFKSADTYGSVFLILL